jgi:glycosyltransferase involved in cell wall biosynthesis
MRIAYLGIKGLPAQGGVDRVVDALTRQLAGRHTLTVYCTYQNTPPGTQVPGVRLQRLPALPGKYTYMTSADMLAAWHAVIFGAYDLIHLQLIEAAFTLPILRLRYPVVATAHGRISPGSRWGRAGAGMIGAMEYPFARWSSLPTSVSREHAEQLTARFGRTVRYIPNGVQPAPAVDLDAARGTLRAHGIDGESYWLFAAGRILPLKGAHVLLEAHRQAAAGQRLVVVGDLSPVPEYARQLQALAGDRVTFVPFVSAPAELLGLIQLSSLFIFPSIQEGMSMMLLEAASLGVPMLISNIRANTEVLPYEALYFQSGDAASLAEKLRWASANTQALAALAKTAQSHVRERYGWDVVAQQYEQAYFSALEGAHPKRATAAG